MKVWAEVSIPLDEANRRMEAARASLARGQRIAKWVAVGSVVIFASFTLGIYALSVGR